MTTVTISYPNGAQEEVLLSGVPREGETIRLANGAPGVTLVVLHVLWLQATAREVEPQVIVEVRPRDNS